MTLLALLRLNNKRLEESGTVRNFRATKMGQSPFEQVLRLENQRLEKYDASLAGFSDWIAGGRRGRAGNGPVSDGPDGVPRAAGRKLCPGANAPVSRSAGGDANAQARGARSVAGPRDAACRAGQAHRAGNRAGPEGRGDGDRHGPEGCGDSRCSGNEGPREGDRFGKEGPCAGGRSGKEGAREGGGPESTAAKAAHRGASRTPRPHSPHPGPPVPTGVQHPRQHGRRSDQVLLGLRLPERG